MCSASIVVEERCGRHQHPRSASHVLGKFTTWLAFYLQKSRSLLVLRFDVSLDGHVELLASDVFVNLKDVSRAVLEVRRSVVAGGDEATIVLAVTNGGENWGHRVEAFNNITAELVNTDLDLLEGLFGFHVGGDDGDPHTVGGNLVFITDDADVDVELAGWVTSLGNLVGGDDNLARATVVGLWDRVLQQADGTDNGAELADLVLGVIRCFANNHRSTGSHVSGANANSLAVSVEQNLVNVLVEHEGAAVNRTQAGEAFRKAAQTIDGVQVRRTTVAVDRETVQPAGEEGGEGRLVQVLIRVVQGHGVPDEILGVSVQVELLVHLRHGGSAGVNLVHDWVVFGHLAHEDKEATKVELLDHSDQRRLERFASSGRDLGEFAGLLLLSLHDVRSVNDLETEVRSDLGVEEDFDEVAAGHQKLGDKVNVEVAVGAKGLELLLGGFTVAELLEQIGQVERSALGSVEVVAVHDEHSLLANGKKSGQHALRGSGTKHDDIVLSVGKSLVLFAAHINVLFSCTRHFCLSLPC